MLTIVIFDDDILSLSQTHVLVEKSLPADIDHTIRLATNIDELEAVVSSEARIDILFCDIAMPEGRPSGIDIVQQLFPPESGTQVIYISGYLELAPEVYRTNHLYFLLKPIDPAKLTDAIGKALAQLSSRQPTMLRIKCGHRDQLVSASIIRYIESNLHKATINCGSKSFETYAKLDDLQTQLPAFFSRCHRSFLVNLSFVKSLSESELHLTDGTTLPVSRRRAHQVQHDLLAHITSQG